MPRGRAWLKMWIEWIHDPKMLKLTWAERGMWWALLSLAGECGAGGKLITSAGEAMSLETIERCLHIRKPEAKPLISMIEKMENMGSLHWNADILTISHWEDRQITFPSERPEAVRDRVRRHRERKATGNDKLVSPLNNPQDKDIEREVEVEVECNDRYLVTFEPTIDTKSNGFAVTKTPRQDPFLPIFSQLFEQNIGLIGGLMAEQLRDYAQSYRGPAEWIKEAFMEAARANVMKWSYIRAILDRWQREGKGEPRKGFREHRGDPAKNEVERWKVIGDEGD